jgi:nitric oxide reductase subunit B
MERDYRDRLLRSDPAMPFLLLAVTILIAGGVFGCFAAAQYVFPALFRDGLPFQRTRPLHVYLVISWILTAAIGGLYHYLPPATGRPLPYPRLAGVHFVFHAATICIATGFLAAGIFGGREYQEYPPQTGIMVGLSWILFFPNFFGSVRGRFRHGPVYFWSWTTGLVFYLITTAESFLWLFPWFRDNIVRDVTVQWKSMGSMVGSWNMLVYGTSLYVMERITGDKEAAKSKEAFLLYALGLMNLMLNWGHHTYIVPAAGWVREVSYAISMTELLIFGHLLLQARKKITDARRAWHDAACRFLYAGEFWIFLNLALAILISIPAINRYTHGTHITVAHAMGTTIGINTMLLMGSLFFILTEKGNVGLRPMHRTLLAGTWITNLSLLLFFISMIAGGIIKISERTSPFHDSLQKLLPFFRVFMVSGILVFVGLSILAFAFLAITFRKPRPTVARTRHPEALSTS